MFDSLTSGQALVLLSGVIAVLCFWVDRLGSELTPHDPEDRCGSSIA
jgi:hypothetical protein